MALLIGIFVAVFFWLSHPKITTQAHQKINIVAAENVWGDIARQIGGENVSVTSLINDPATDPHLYESSAKDASAVDTASIVIVNGQGYDDFIDKLLPATPRADRHVINIASVLEAKPGDNPHFWYDIARTSVVAAQLEQTLASSDPQHAGMYSANLASFVESLQPLFGVIQTIDSVYPQAPVAYTERLPGYLITATNLAVKSPEGFAQAIENGSDPSPGDQTTFTSLINKKQIRLLFYNSQASSPAAEKVRAAAEKNSIPVVALTEMLPKNMPSYQAWQLSQLQAILTAFERTK